MHYFSPSITAWFVSTTSQRLASGEPFKLKMIGLKPRWCGQLVCPQSDRFPPKVGTFSVPDGTPPCLLELLCQGHTGNLETAI